ncbi:cell division protein FtsQ/DivIB [Curvibacter sp. CHRR-16]|uniref:cell division protein FtsQ/DivIB n=1 Tax=Curvibacter sp. CHRR-16 TaxID=2835872 RepID=UPI001BDB6554|nr:cell division protein FtsQ/DivIB [Curvibacter sp. CHRR-16]MBT0569963.1 cell division protein FtsQ/DivIB [Curvibacter sp. CHRR-16]
MSQAVTTPMDVRLMNATAALLVLVFAGLCVVAAGRYVVGLPLFRLQGISVEGDTNHNNAVTLRANVAPRVQGTFFTVNLQRVREAFEAVPWVRQAVVRREFPNRLRVELQEHQAVAYWGEQQLVNSHGEVFDANVDEVEQDKLPSLSGPDGQSALVLDMYRQIAPEMQRLDLPVAGLELTGRGSWRVQLESNAVVELGRGTQQEVMERVQRFTHTLTQVTARYGRTPQALESADLRHENGYAVKLQGVTTLAADATPRKK